MNCFKLVAVLVLVCARPVWAVEPAPMEVTDDVMASRPQPLWEYSLWGQMKKRS